MIGIFRIGTEYINIVDGPPHLHLLTPKLTDRRTLSEKQRDIAPKLSLQINKKKNTVIQQCRDPHQLSPT